MASLIKIKRSATSGKRPTLEQIALGELALNTYDGYLFTKRDTGGVGIGTTVILLTPWTENYGAGSIYYQNNVGIGTDNTYDVKLSVDGTVKVTGVATFTNNIDVSGDLDVDGHTELDNLNVSGVSTFSSSVDIDSDLDVDGITNLDITNISESLNVIGIATFASDVYFNGGLNLGDYIEINNINVSSALTATNLVVTGSTLLSHSDSLKFQTTGIGVSVSNGIGLTATIAGPSNLIIDPGVVGDDTGVVRIKGDLFVDGTTTQINSTTIELADFIVGIASTATSDLLTDGAGIQIGPDNTFLYEFNGGTNPSLKSSENLNVASGKGYQIDQTEVLNATTLGTGVTNSSLTNLGTLTALTVSGAIDADGDLDVDGITELDITNISETLNVSGISTFASDVDLNANLDVDGITELDVTNISETLNVSGISTFVSDVDLNANLDVDGVTELDVTNISETLNVSGISTFASDVDLNADLDVDGRTELDVTNISETLNVSGVSTFGSNVDLNADLDVAGNLDVDGVTELDVTNISETLNVSGVSTFASDVDLNANLDVDGITELDITNISETLNVSGVSTFASDVDLNANLDVDGITELDVTNISETLSVTGITTFNSDVNVGGALSVTGNSYFVGMVTFAGGTDGNISIGDSTGDNVIFNAQIDSDLIPDDDGAYDLGSSTKEWKDLFIDGTANIDTLSADTVSVGDLTNNRVVIVGENGELEDDVNLTFDGNQLALGVGLTVTGIATFANDIDANGNLDVDGITELDITNISETLSVTGIATFSSNVDLNADLDVDGITELDVTNISETLSVTGIATFASNVDLNADLDVDGRTELDITNISETLNVVGVSTFASDVDLNGNLDVDGITELDVTNISETLSVTGIATFANNIDANGNLDVDGITELDVTNISETLSVIGIATFANNIDANGNLDVAGNLDVDGITELDITNISETLNVSGVSTFGSNVDVDGNLDVDGRTELDITNISETLSVTGIATFSSNVDLNANLDVDGRTELDVTNISETLNVVGVSTFGSNVDLNGNLNVSGDLDVNGSIEFNDINVSGVVTATAFHTGAEGSAIRVTSNTISGPSEIIIDPAAVGDNTGAIRIKGDLFVDGTQTQINSTTIELADFIVGVATTATTNLLTDGAGIGIGSDKFFTFDNSNTAFKSTENLNLETGHTYKIAGTDVLSATTLGSGVVNSSLTKIGTLSELNVSGVSTFTGNIDANGNLDVDGRTELDIVNIGETLNVVGIATFANNIDANGNLDVDGVTNLDVTNISETLNVDGIATFDNNIDANGNLDVDGITELDVTNISETLNVVGVSTFTSTVNITPSSDVEGLIIDSTSASTEDTPHITLKGGGPQVIDFRDTSDGNGIRISYRTTPNQWRLEKSESDGYIYFLADRDDGRLELYHNNSKKFETTDTGVTITGIATAAIFYAESGTFAAGNDTRTDATIVIEEEGSIYTRDGVYLRNLIQKKSDIINIGEQNTSLIDGIELKPGTTGGSVKLHAGGSSDNVKLETTSTGINVTGHAELDDVNVSSALTSTNLVVTGSTLLNHSDSLKFQTTGIGVSIVNGIGDTATIAGPSNLIIDPGVVGDNTGIVRIKGDLFVDGTQTQINSTTIELADFIVGIATTATSDLLTDGAGILIGPDNTFLYEFNGGTNPSLKSSENLNVASGKVYQIGETERLSADTLSLGTGTTIHSPASNVLTFGTNNEERVRITSDGNVGINESSPDQKLHITQTASGAQYPILLQNRTNADSSVGIQFIATGSDLSDGQYASIEANGPTAGNTKHDLVFKTVVSGGTPTERLRITSDGKVGIGTDNPNNTIHLYDSAAFASFTNNADTGESGILFRRHDNNQNRGKVTYSFTDDALLFRASNNGSGENLRITSDGNVGIGSAIPAGKLDVVGHTELDDVNVSGVVTTTSITIGSPGSTYLMPTTDGNQNQILSTDGSGTVSFIDPDKFGGNRIYVSASLGNDSNDGKTAPVKTIKKAAQLAAAESFVYPVTIMVAGGDYKEDNPIILADDVAVVGDNLRRVIVRPQNRLRDCFRVRNGNYITGIVFKDNIEFPTGPGVRHGILDQAGIYAKALVNETTGSTTNYRSITPTTTPVVASSSRLGVSNRIDELITLTKDSITNESTIVPTESGGNSDQEFTDAGTLIISNVGASVGVASTAYIPGNAVGWSTSASGGNYTLSDSEITDFEEDVHNIMLGIADDLRYGGTSGNEYTLQKIRNIVVGTPSKAFDYVISFDDPLDTTTSRDGYVGLSSDKPRITQSPYIQNCSIISFLGANGANVDGSKIIQENEPIVGQEAETPFVGDIPDQGKSMVANAFTAVSFGGIGWKVSNAGYAQIVSCFQIFCSIGSYAQSGGYLSITNSATNFGLYALRSTGFRAQAFDFDKGFIFSDGTSGVNQTLRVGGLQRDEQDLYVLRFINLTNGLDQTTNFKQAGITTSLSSSGINTTTDTIDISGVSGSLSDADGLLYIAPSNENQIGGLINDTVYYIDKVGAGTSANLYFDDELKNKVDLLDVPAGIHTFTKVAEEFFVSEIIEKNNTYQNLTLSDSIGVGVTFVPGTSITQTRSDDAIAVGFAVTWTSTVLTVSVENSINSSGGTERLLFQTTTTASGGSGNGKITDENGTETSVNSVASRSDLHTINFKVDSTISGNSIQSITSLPKAYKCHLHRPSIVNSSAHTWEYAGSGIDYNALPQNGGTANADLEQYNESGGRVFSSGTNELGDFKIGDSITAFNRTGNIEFKNKVTIGQLDSLELSLSGGVKITEISVSKQLGENELGGPLDSRLSTQAAIRGYLVNRLGSFIDQNKSTAAIPSAVPQLNSQGLLDPGMIPAQIRFNNVFDTNVSGGRTDLVNDVPAIEILKSDIVTEEFVGAGDTFVTTNNYTLTFENESQFLILSSDTQNYAFNNGDEVIASQNNAVGIVTIPTHPSYGSTGLVKGVINSITLTNGGSGYGAAGIYSGVNLVSITGSGTSATADVTVDSLGAVESVNIRKGGRYYASGDTFRVDASDIGNNSGTEFTARVDNVDTRLYVKLTGEKQQFFASTSVPDFISDGTVSSASTDFSTVYTETIIPTSVGVGGSVFFTENSILFNPNTFDFDTGDPIIYTVSGGTAIGQLENNKTYFAKKVGVSSIQLSESYDGDTIVPLDSSGTGTHQFKRLGVSTVTDFIVFKDHGFESGQSVKYTTNDGPSGIATGSYYFVGSVTTNAFTLHDVRQDALNSINGSTVNARDLTTVGSGIGTFDIQNVTFVKTVNTSSNNIDNFSILVSSADIDASNIISGTISPDRLASTGTPNNTTFLRGDQKWETAVQTIAVGVGTTSALIVTGLTPSGEIAGTGINTYYGNLQLDVKAVNTVGVGVGQYSNIGVSRFRFKQDSNNVGPFKITDSGHLVDLETTSSGSNNNGIDAYSFQGQNLANVVDLSNSTVNGNPRNVLPSTNGGTGLDNSSGGNQGKVLFCDTINNGVAVFGASSSPTINGTLGVGYFDSNASNTKGTLDINKVASHDTAEKTTTGIGTTSIFTFDKSTFRTAKFVISVTDSTINEYHSTEMLVIHDGTNAYKTEYGSIFTSELATFDVDISGDDVRVLAGVTTTNTVEFKVYANSLIRA